MVAPDEMTQAGDWVWPPQVTAVPVVACIPHGGRHLPADFTQDLAIDPGALRSDWLTQELYAFLPELGITTIVTALSRFVADVNRDPAGDQHGRFWSSVVAAQTAKGRALYRRPLTQQEIDHRVRLAHEPFHRALDSAIAGLLSAFGRVLLLDLHSFGIELDADVVLGDRHGQSARPQVTDLVDAALTGQGFEVSRNRRFPGGWTVRRFIGHDLVDAVQIEVAQRRYPDLTGPRRPGQPLRGQFEPTQRLLAAALGRICAGFAALPAGTGGTGGAGGAERAGGTGGTAGESRPLGSARCRE
jgi:N-formylglutamate deformylase